MYIRVSCDKKANTGFRSARLGNENKVDESSFNSGQKDKLEFHLFDSRHVITEQSARVSDDFEMDLNLDLAKMICNKLSGNLVTQSKRSGQVKTNSWVASFIADVANYQNGDQIASARNSRESNNANGEPRAMNEDESE